MPVTDSIAVTLGDHLAIHITMQVPDALGAQVQQVQDRLPAVFARGLRDLQADGASSAHDERAIDVLASQPTPDEVLALRPSDAMQQRASLLLARGMAPERRKGYGLLHIIEWCGGIGCEEATRFTP